MAENPYLEVLKGQAISDESSAFSIGGKRKLESISDAEIPSGDEGARVFKNNSSSTDLTEIFNSLKPHLKKEKKCIKAMKLLTKLIHSKLDTSTSNFFISVMVQLMHDEICLPLQDLHIKSYQSAISELWNSFSLQRGLFISFIGVHCCESFYLYSSFRLRLLTDDTFEFAKCCKELEKHVLEWSTIYNDTKEQLKSSDKGRPSADSTSQGQEETPPLPGGYIEIAEVLSRTRIFAVLKCLEISLKNYFHDWAKRPVDTLYALASNNRMHVNDDDLRGQLDDLVTRVTLEQRKLASKGASISKTIRTYDSVAHPLLRRNDGILR